ncbi:SUMO-activating enzyme subunit 1 isoform X1 [Heterodontus francisci]|uniref:SUMO-activating enzyme subunit 1 isoform X1 n=2 Tax=Heterodontus francisci TaxID=7792 RepID=UPI00355B0AB7
MVEKEEAVISEEEAAQYDRQIRLWGLEAQKRLRGSRVLLVGMKGLGAEVAKNLTLAGVKALTLLDHQQATPEDARSQFLIPNGSLGRNRAEASLERAQNLNPMVEVKVVTENIKDKSQEFFAQYDAVCLTCCPLDVMVRIDQFCRTRNIKFFAGDVFGYHGYMFSNLGEHEFVEEKQKVVKVGPGEEDGPKAKKVKIDPNETTLIKKTVSFCPLKEALEVDWSNEKAKMCLKRTPSDYFLLQVLLKFRTVKARDPLSDSYEDDSALLLQLRNNVLDSLGVKRDLLTDEFISSCFSELAPVCAVVGGVLSQEIVKALSQRDPPHNNFFFFDGLKSNGIVDCIGPK